MAVGAVKAVAGCEGMVGDGDVLRLLLPLLFHLNLHGRFGLGRRGPIRLLGLRQ